MFNSMKLSKDINLNFGKSENVDGKISIKLSNEEENNDENQENDDEANDQKSRSILWM